MGDLTRAREHINGIWTELCAIHGGVVADVDGASVFALRTAAPVGNQVRAWDRSLDIVAALPRIAATVGQPFLLEADDQVPAAAALAGMEGVVGPDPLPTMTARSVTADPRGPVPGLAIERVTTLERLAVFRDTTRIGFGATDEIAWAFAPDGLLAVEGTTFLLGTIDGEAVTTGFSMTIDGITGIFNVSTVPEARGRGYGRAITERLVGDAIDSDLFYLQASAPGRPIYEAMGFTVVATCSTYTVTPPATS